MKEMPERKLGYCRIPTVLITIFVFLQDKHIVLKKNEFFIYEQLILYYKLSLSRTEYTAWSRNKPKARIGKVRLKDELHVTEDEVEAAEVVERDKDLDTKCDSWRWKKKGKKSSEKRRGENELREEGMFLNWLSNW
jgi:hypothetical protein